MEVINYAYGDSSCILTCGSKCLGTEKDSMIITFYLK
jgi:hypothetical protein